MLRLSCRVMGKPCLLLLLVSLAANSALAQLETATVSGQVVDPSGLSITGAQVKLVDIDRDTITIAVTNNSGLYSFPSVKPGRYRMEIRAAGFRVINFTGLTINVQDHLEQNFSLTVGSISESVTVEGGTPLVEHRVCDSKYRHRSSICREPPDERPQLSDTASTYAGGRAHRKHNQ